MDKQETAVPRSPTGGIWRRDPSGKLIVAPTPNAESLIGAANPLNDEFEANAETLAASKEMLGLLILVSALDRLEDGGHRVSFRSLAAKARKIVDRIHGKNVAEG